jgi:hypothetical protein
LTPGVATAEGPNWIKVSFREGGVDVPFVTDLQLPDGRYWIASEIAGGKEIKKIVDLPEKSFFHNGVRYNGRRGDAVDWETWNAVIGHAKPPKGVRHEK